MNCEYCGERVACLNCDEAVGHDMADMRNEVRRDERARIGKALGEWMDEQTRLTCTRLTCTVHTLSLESLQRKLRDLGVLP